MVFFWGQCIYTWGFYDFKITESVTRLTKSGTEFLKREQKKILEKEKERISDFSQYNNLLWCDPNFLDLCLMFSPDSFPLGFMKTGHTWPSPTFLRDCSAACWSVFLFSHSSGWYLALNLWGGEVMMKQGQWWCNAHWYIE